jgi:DNA-binding CsgD family transcriptional regulator/tetratricopeptide (TPR) repeat protein
VLLGRDAELALLAERAESGLPVALLGEAGVGKTTLARAAAGQSRGTVFEGGGLSTLSWVPYLALSRAVGVDFPAGDDLYIAKEVEARVASGVLIVDDLQWVDTATWRVLPLLAGTIALVTAVRRGDPRTEEALAVAHAAGCEVVEIEPLNDQAALGFVKQLRPDIADTAAARLVRRTGGNPLLIEEMAKTGEPSESLRFAIAARLRALPEDGKHAMAMLALAGHPLRSSAIGGAAGSLVRSGIAEVRKGDAIALRHSLLGEVYIDTLNPAERRTVHSDLALALDDLGESARHHAEAGENEIAYAKAIEAAERATWPAERAAHLGVAAACSSGSDADHFRLRAATALLEVGEYGAVLGLLALVAPTNAETKARICRDRGAALAATNDIDGALAAFTEGLALVEGSDTELEIDLRLFLIRTRLDVDGEFTATAEAARRCFDDAVALGAHQRPEMLRMLGAAQAMTDVEGWEEMFIRASAEARTQGLFRAEIDVMITLGSTYFVKGRIADARTAAESIVSRSRELRLSGQEQGARATLLMVYAAAGEYSKLIEEAGALLDEPLVATTLSDVERELTDALVMIGDFETARRTIDRNLPAAAPTWNAKGAWLEALAHCEFWSGRPESAIRSIDEALGIVPLEAAIALRLCRAWSSVDLGRDPGPSIAKENIPSFMLIFATASIETEALGHLADGADLPLAVALFDEGVSGWEGVHFESEMRCRWGAAESLRRYGDRSASLTRFEALEATATEHAMKPLLARIHRSMRLAGVYRSAERSSGVKGSLTPREREVLGLVAQGLTNLDIARRLGVGRPTVARTISTASAKLGATTRGQAAALATQT